MTKNDDNKKTKSEQLKKNKNKSKSKNKSINKIENNSKIKSQQSQHSNSILNNSNSKDNESLISKTVINKLRKIESMSGAIMIRNEMAINSAGYFINHNNTSLINQTEYSQILFATKNSSLTSSSSLTTKKSLTKKIIVKIINLTELSPKLRKNLLHYSVRIQRFLTLLQKKQKMPSLSLFIKIYEIFQMESIKLYIFMNECKTNVSLYNLLCTNTNNNNNNNVTLKPDEIREYIRTIINGINILQKYGISHRNLKLQNLLFNYNNQIKLCGWNRAVYIYDLNDNNKNKGKNSRLLLQNIEKRVRRNYFLPPETFENNYNTLNLDVWSIGIILVAMTTKRYPFNVRDKYKKFSKQWNEFICKHEMNLYVRNLCNKIFIINQSERLTCEQLLLDQYFNLPINKLIPLSIKAVNNELIEYESSTIGALSAVDFSNNNLNNNLQQQQQLNNDDNEIYSNIKQQSTSTATAQQDQNDNNDGGAVGDEENATNDEEEKLTTESKMENNEQNNEQQNQNNDQNNNDENNNETTEE